MMRDAWATLTAVLDQANDELKKGGSAAPRVWPTGFDPLDDYLGGGVRAGELTLLGGPQGTGKTTWALQVMRNMAAAGATATYFSFEHDDRTLLERLICLESAEMFGTEGVPLADVRRAMEAVDPGTDLSTRLAAMRGGAGVLEGVSAWSDRLSLHRASGATTTVDGIRRHVEEASKRSDPTVVVVDYLQKVAYDGPELGEAEQVTHVVEGLKDLALDYEVPVIAVVAADREGIESGKRMRVHNLRGSTSLAYEADVVLIMNDKFDVVARHHLVYDASNAERFHDWAVVSIEKNRTGVDRVDLEFRKRFEQSRFESKGSVVQERLVDERVYVE
jgi:replicative DNA helicase